jgi:hypothetical protein
LAATGPHAFAPPAFQGYAPAPARPGGLAAPPFQSGVGLVCIQKSFFCKAPSATEFNFGRNEKQNMAENPFVRSERRERKSYYRTPWIFRQILLVVKPKIKFWFIGVFPAFLYKKRKI